MQQPQTSSRQNNTEKAWKCKKQRIPLMSLSLMARIQTNVFWTAVNVGRCPEQF